MSGGLPYFATPLEILRKTNISYRHRDRRIMFYKQTKRVSQKKGDPQTLSKTDHVLHICLRGPSGLATPLKTCRQTSKETRTETNHVLQTDQEGGAKKGDPQTFRKTAPMFGNTLEKCRQTGKQTHSQTNQVLHSDQRGCRKIMGTPPKLPRTRIMSCIYV